MGDKEAGGACCIDPDSGTATVPSQTSQQRQQATCGSKQRMTSTVCHAVIIVNSSDGKMRRSRV